MSTIFPLFNSATSIPIALEKTANPAMINVIVKILPASEIGAISPNPTVVKVYLFDRLHP